MEDKLQAFIVATTGVKVGDTKENYGECVGLVMKWTDNLGLPHTWGNAIDLLKNADPNFFDIVYNKLGDTSQFPPDGAIVVLGKPFGRLQDGNYAGHTGISKGSDGNTLRLFQQNDPTGSTPQMKEYSYDACIGWMVPKNVNTTNTDALDACMTDRTKFWEERDLARNIIKELCSKLGTEYQEGQEEDAKNKATVRIQELIGAETSLTEARKETTGYKGKYEDEQRENVRLNELLSQKANTDKDYAQQTYEAQKERDALASQLKDIKEVLGVSADIDPKELLTTILDLKEPNDKAINEYQKLFELFFEEGLALYKRIPKTQPFISKLLKKLKGLL